MMMVVLLLSSIWLYNCIMSDLIYENSYLPREYLRKERQNQKVAFCDQHDTKIYFQKYSLFLKIL